MTKRLYYDDAYLTRFSARIVERGCDPCEVYLDQTAFYPTSGGQPYDTGTVGGMAVVDVVESEDRIQHRLAKPVNSDIVECEINWPRRFDHMQQHSGQHLLSAVFSERFNLDTIGFHLGDRVSTLDLNTASLSDDQLREVEERVNEIVAENRPLRVVYEDAASAEGLRKESDREGTLRIVTIENLDRSACGGTHVRATGEIGLVQIRKTEKIRGDTRIEFLCGRRAVRRARADFDCLTKVARVFSAQLDETPDLVAAQQQKLAEAGKARRRLAREVAGMRGRELYQSAQADANGLRIVVRRLNQGPAGEDLRSEAQAFAANSRAVFLALIESPTAVLLAVSKDAGIHAGNILNPLLDECGGRGGGHQNMAQGSLPSKDALDNLALKLEGAIKA